MLGFVFTQFNASIAAVQNCLVGLAIPLQGGNYVLKVFLWCLIFFTTNGSVACAVWL